MPFPFCWDWRAIPLSPVELATGARTASVGAVVSVGTVVGSVVDTGSSAKAATGRTPTTITSAKSIAMILLRMINLPVRFRNGRSRTNHYDGSIIAKKTHEVNVENAVFRIIAQKKQGCLREAALGDYFFRATTTKRPSSTW